MPPVIQISGAQGAMDRYAAAIQNAGGAARTGYCPQADLSCDGLLLCGGEAAPLLFGGTGSESLRRDMPDLLPERLEPGTLNVPGAAGLDAGMRHVLRRREAIAQAEHRQAERCARGLAALGMRVFSGAHQAGTVSFVPEADCERAAELLARRGIALRAGLHCAPLAHESAGTLETGTVRVSFGPDAADWQTDALLAAAARGFAG